MTRYTITPRPPHRDVLLEREGSPTVLVVRREGFDMDALEIEARRIAAALDEHLTDGWQPRPLPGCACRRCEERRAVKAALDGGDDG